MTINMRTPCQVSGLKPWTPFIRQALGFIVGLSLVYLILPLAVFDFTSVAVPFDEETHNGRSVGLGPRPYRWVPGASHGLDIPGGFEYSTEEWPFVLWKPLCFGFLKIKGYELPSEWRALSSSP
jgi:hypothetical protein